MRLSQAPATSVLVDILVNTECGLPECNSADKVTVTPSQLEFKPWVSSLKYTVSVNNWDKNIGSVFYLDFVFNENSVDYAAFKNDGDDFM